MNWFLRLLGFKKVEVPAPIHELPAAPVPLNDVFLEAIQESYDAQYKLELELMNDAKLREYIKNTVKAMVNDLEYDRYDFIMLYPHDAKISPHIWEPFAKIMSELCKTIDLPTELRDGHLYAKKSDVKRAFNALKVRVIDIDERVRAMLSQGIYR